MKSLFALVAASLTLTCLGAGCYTEPQQNFQPQPTNPTTTIGNATRTDSAPTRQPQDRSQF